VNANTETPTGKAAARCLIVQHVAPEGSYAIGDALTSAGVGIDLRQVFAGDRLPLNAADFEGLVIMGGPMSASSDDGFPTRRAELDLIADAVARGKPTLGVCLGAQLLALACGGRVHPGAAGPEVGWAPVLLSESAATDPLLAGLPSPLTVLHWHWDTFEVPAEAVNLAGSARYANQAFRTGSNAWGFQFHLEIDEAAVGAFLEAFGSDAHAAGTSPDAITAAGASTLEALSPYRSRVLSKFAKLVATHSSEAPVKLTQ
jgi:GMP synthase-like glutamine amidotransferase